MKKTLLYNNLSKALLDSTKLKKDQRVTFRLYDIRKNPINPEKLAIPASKNVPPIDTIWDEEKGEYVDIAAVLSVNGKGEHKYHHITFTKQGAGHITLHGGRATDQEIYSFLMLTNTNGSNPNRDTSKEIIFELVSEEAKAETEVRSRNVRREAMNAAADLDADTVKIYTAALGKDDTRQLKIMRNELEFMAENHPEDFMNLVNDKSMVVKATINRAISKGVIIFNSEQSRFEWPTKEAILTVSRKQALDAVDELATYCTSSAKGEKVLQTIQSKVK